jgi:hypothetical protein
MNRDGQFEINESDIVGSIDDYNAISADPVSVVSPKFPAPQPPAEGAKQPRYRRILGGVPTWTEKTKALADTRQDRQLQNWQKHAAEWDKVDRRLASQLGKAKADLRTTSHRKHQMRTKGQELIDSTRYATITHTHPSGQQTEQPDVWPRLDKFDDQATGTVGAAIDYNAVDGHAKLTYKHLRDERAGPQFWVQPELRAKSKLPIAVQYQNAVHEFIGRPTAMRKELKLDEDAAADPYHNAALLASMPLHATGKMPNTFGGVDGWAPDVDALCVEGTSVKDVWNGETKPKVEKRGMEQPIAEWDRDGEFEDTIVEGTEEEEQEMPLPKHGNKEGPHLVCRSTGDSINSEATACRVTFDSTAGASVTSTMTVQNSGTTAVHFSWQRAAKVNTLGTRMDKIDRFNFDRRPGVLLSGDSKTFSFEFNSASAGIYTEAWLLDTKPALDSAPLITLCGTCKREDVHARDRLDVEATLEQRMIANHLRAMLYDLVRKVQPSARPRSPASQWVTLETRFKRSNLQPDSRSVDEQKAVAGGATLPESNGDGGDGGDGSAAEVELELEAPASNHFFYAAVPFIGPLGYEERLVVQAQKLFASAWQQHWTQTNFPVLRKAADPNRATVKSAKGGKDKKPGAADVEPEGPVFAVPEAPEWDLNLSGLKQLLLDLEDDKAAAVESNEWKPQQVYLAEYMEIAIGLAVPQVAPPLDDRAALARELLVRMAEAVAEKCTFSRKLHGLPEPAVFVAPQPEIESYVPRVDLASLGGKGKGGKKAPPKDDKKGKDAKGKKGGDEAAVVAPVPLEPEVAAKLAPIQFMAAREAVVDMLVEWDTVIPFTQRVSAEDDY